MVALLGAASIPLYLHAQTAVGLWFGALLMGSCGSGIWGMAPAYVSERFPTSARGVGPGFTYHAGAAIGAVMPVVLGTLPFQSEGSGHRVKQVRLIRDADDVGGLRALSGDPDLRAGVILRLSVGPRGVVDGHQRPVALLSAACSACLAGRAARCLALEQSDWYAHGPQSR